MDSALPVRDFQEILESFAGARRNGFIAIKTLKEQGRGVIGTFCSYIPVELFMAAGLIPVNLRPAGDEAPGEGEKILPPNLCSIVKAGFAYALTDKCPYTYFTDLIVGETGCEGRIRLYELLGKIKDVYVMKLPHTQSGAAPGDLWLEEIRRLGERIREQFKVEIRVETLRRAIAERNRERALLKELYELCTLKPPPMTGWEQLNILYGAQFKFDHGEKIRELEEAIGCLKGDYAAGKRRVSEEAKRIVVTGCPMGDLAGQFIRIIEEEGGVVVVYENCTGARQADRQVDESADPWEALRDYYLAIGCGVMMPNPKRLELLGRLCDQFAADGVIDMTLRHCSIPAAENRTVEEFLEARGIPFLSLETGCSAGDMEGYRKTVAAFIGTLSSRSEGRERICL
jgi:benzoyl-CoA reductase/2-hydroxyglutaryl-CoA dehydratase subunit BcrC/BadD/HgdB